MEKMSAILVAGGASSRMGGGVAKPFLSLGSIRVIEWSLRPLLDHPLISEVIVVCSPEYQTCIEHYPVRFAPPGAERAISVYHGLQMATSPWVCIHDAARPFIPVDRLDLLFQEAQEGGAASFAIPVRGTVRRVDSTEIHWVDREGLWEMQTPQVIATAWAQMAFDQVDAEHCTDDLALVEAIGKPVRLVMGSPKNFKITTPADYEMACALSQSIEVSCATI